MEVREEVVVVVLHEVVATGTCVVVAAAVDHDVKFVEAMVTQKCIVTSDILNLLLLLKLIQQLRQ